MYWPFLVLGPHPIYPHIQYDFPEYLGICRSEAPGRRS
jgi:hypothetical protein